MNLPSRNVEPVLCQPMAEKLSGFVTELRGLGFNIGMNETRDALFMAAEGGAQSRPLFQAALKHLFCTTTDEWDVFDALFLTYFAVETDLPEQGENEGEGQRFEKQFQQDFQIVADFYQSDEGNEEGGAGRDQAVTKTDFRFLTESEGWEEAARAAEMLAKKIKMRRTRRWKRKRHGPRIDLPSTMRKLTATGGEPLILGRRKRKQRPFHVVALLDVSHSMSYYSPMLARFVRGLVHHFENTEAFCFHIELHHITPLLKEPDREVMRQRMEALENLWFGGTNIAGSLRQFNERFLEEVTNRHSVALLFSDGCDTCSGDEVVPEVATLKRFVRRLYWVNPMQARLEGAGLTSASPLMAAKSYIDGCVSGDSLRSLEKLARVITR